MAPSSYGYALIVVAVVAVVTYTSLSFTAPPSAELISESNIRSRLTPKSISNPIRARPSQMTPTLQRKWAVAQVFDCYRPQYSTAILSTNEAISKWKSVSGVTIEHVVIGWHCGCESLNLFPQIPTIVTLFAAAGVKFYATSDIADEKSIMKQTGLSSVNQFNAAFSDKNGRSYKQFGGKLNLWNLTEYDRLLYMDHDIVPVRDLGHLFYEAEERSKMIDCTHPIWGASDPAMGYCMNSGVLMITPSSEQHMGMLKQLAEPAIMGEKSFTTQLSACTSNVRSKSKQLDSDQDFIQMHFQKQYCFQALSPMYNIMTVVGKGDLKLDYYNNRFLTWVLSNNQTRKMAYALHVGWPKPDMFFWKGEAKNRFFDPPETPTLTESQTAFVSIFKTYWLRYTQAITRACLKLEPSSFRDLNGPLTTCGLVYEQAATANFAATKAFCEKPMFEKFFEVKEAAIAKSFVEDDRIPPWEDM
eukprot:m.139501 g.139501  ORF g.139501 m.139501 type:complete len:472 (-) comp30062_c0_seq1:65-1480(-)